MGTLFVEAQAGATADAVKNAAELMTILQIDWLQPIYTYTFSNGLIACLVFMGIGALLDVGYVMARPFQSMFIAVCAELGTIVTFPIAQLFGYTPQQARPSPLLEAPMVRWFCLHRYVWRRSFLSPLPLLPSYLVSLMGVSLHGRGSWCRKADGH